MRSGSPHVLRACGHNFSLQALDLPWPESSEWRRVQAQLRERPLAVAWHQDAAGIWLDLGDSGRALFQPTRGVLQVSQLPTDADLRTEVLYGPLLLHALAWQGWYALHASCVQLGHEPEAPAVALVAASGTGKSTLAQAAAAQGWRRLSDDVLPYRIDDGALQVRGDFPQLKLPASAQPTESGETPLAALVLLRRGERGACIQLDARAASRTLLTHTLGSRLYTDMLLRAQFACAAQAAELVARGALTVCQLTVAEQDDVNQASRAALDALRLALQ